MLIFGGGVRSPFIDRVVAGEGVTGRQDWNKTLFDYVPSNLAGLQMSLSGAAQISPSPDLTAPILTPPFLSCLPKQGPKRTP
jgi:hypothetical protein